MTQQQEKQLIPWGREQAATLLMLPILSLAQTVSCQEPVIAVFSLSFPRCLSLLPMRHTVSSLWIAINAAYNSSSPSANAWAPVSSCCATTSAFPRWSKGTATETEESSHPDPQEEAEITHWGWWRSFKLQSLLPMTNFLHQGHTSLSSPNSHKLGTTYSNIWDT